MKLPFTMLRPATWMALLITALVLFFFEVPGRRVSFARYEHGWPFTYLSRDYLKVNTTWLSIGSDWKDNRVPFEVESQMTPWSYVGCEPLPPTPASLYGRGPVEAAALVGDVAISAAFLLVVGAIVRWLLKGRAPRRRQRFQIGIRSLLFCTAALAAICGIAVSLNAHCRTEQRLLDRLISQNVTLEAQYIWRRQDWLPESLEKLLPSQWFSRVSNLELKGYEIDEGEMQAILAFSDLRGLTLEDIRIAGVQTVVVSDCPKLSQLSILDCSPTTITLANLPKLEYLVLFFRGGGSPVVECASLPQLHELWVDGNYNANGSVRDSLVVLKDISTLNSLNDLALSSVRVNSSDVHSIGALTKVTGLTIAKTHFTDHEFAQLPVARLDFLDISGTDVTDQALDHLAEAKNLETLDVSNTAVSHEGIARLKQILPKLVVR